MFTYSKAFLISLMIAAFVWLMDPLVDAWLFGDGSFAQQLFTPSPKELYFRSAISLLILFSGAFVGQRISMYELKNKQLLQQTTLMQMVINSEPECVKTIGRDGKLLEMNPAGLRIIEADSIEDVRYESVYDLIAPEDREQYIQFNARIFNGEQASMEYDVLGLKGSRKRVDSHAVPLYDNRGEIIAHLAITRDITDFKRSQQELQKFSQAVEQCASMVMITDTEGNITYINPRFCSVTGYEKNECLGNTPKLLFSGTHGPEFYAQLWQQISSGEEWRGNVQNRRKSGELFWASVIISPVKDEQDNIIHYLCTQEDITDSHKLTQQLEYQARHCMLTGLVNRHEFQQHLDQLRQQVTYDKSQHAVFFADIDQFKLINDTCGHAAGDQLLRQIGDLIKTNVRQNDLVSRLGGDEFAILIRDCDQSKADQAAEHLRRTIEDFGFAWESQIFRVTISIGCVIIDEFSPDAPGVLSQADASCYMAKDLGRNRTYQHRDIEGDSLRQGEFQWASKIHQGLELNRFQLYIQDIEALQEDEASHYEVLIRYTDEQGTIIPPGAFLPAAERYGLSPKIDRWVVRSVCKILAGELNNRVNLSVNLSGLSVNDGDFLQFVRDCITEYAVLPERLCFEITETATITNLTEAVQFIQQMKEIGCRIALDDFGSGLSSFGYLRTLPIDTVKIDGIFVKNICSNDIDQAMVKSINEIGQLMGKKTVAEYVQDQQSADLLRELGVDYAQGYGIAKPRPILELIRDAKNSVSEKPLSMSE